VDNGEGCPHPQPTSESELCQHGPGSELQPETNLVILLLRVAYYTGDNIIMLMIMRCTQTDGASAFVSQNYLARAGGVVDRVTNFV